MSYRIDYGSNPKPPIKTHSFRLWGLTVCAFGLFFFLVHAFWPEGADLLGRLFLGEGYGDFLEALSRALEGARQGLPLREAAVGAFRELLHGG